MTVTKKRKASKNLDVHEAVKLYLEDVPVSNIAMALESTEKAVNLAISRHIKRLSNMRESKLLVKLSEENASHNTHNKAMRVIQATKTINESFLGLLSDPGDVELTDQEGIFCQLYVMSGNDLLALSESGLEEGLLETGHEGDGTLKVCRKLRCQYLRNKYNIKEYILRLREQQWGTTMEKLDRKWVQTELVIQLRQMQEDHGVSWKDIAAHMRLIGQTVGAYVEKIELTDINPEEALQGLIDAAKNVTPEDEKAMVIEMEAHE